MEAENKKIKMKQKRYRAIQIQEAIEHVFGCTNKVFADCSLFYSEHGNKNCNHAFLCSLSLDII